MVNGQKYITIASDISAVHKLSVATWAYYIRHDAGRIRQAGTFKQYHHSTAMLETLALANALHVADKQLDLSDAIIIIYSELSHMVLRPLKTKAGEPKPTDAERTAVINEQMLPILKKAKAWQLRDVTAHASKERMAADGFAKKYALNRWCDAACRVQIKIEANSLAGHSTTVHIAGKIGVRNDVLCGQRADYKLIRVHHYSLATCVNCKRLAAKQRRPKRV